MSYELEVEETHCFSPPRTRLFAPCCSFTGMCSSGIWDLGEVVRARKPKRLPVVLTRDEVKAIFVHLEGDKQLMAGLMYGAGLCLMECLLLRIQEIDFQRCEIVVRDGKGGKDRRMCSIGAEKGFMVHWMAFDRPSKIKDRGAGYARFGSRTLYGGHGLYKVPTTAGWTKAHALS